MLLLIGTFALIWSMNRHLKKLPEVLRPGHPEPDQAADEGTVETSDEHSSEVGAGVDVPPPDTEGQRHEPGSNTLADATSPYLRQHADNPVHWQQWSAEALAEAASGMSRSCCRSDTRPVTGVTSWRTSRFEDEKSPR